MENYPESVSKYCIKNIFVQMNNFIYCIINNKGEEGKGIFCKIKYNKIIIPVLITNSHLIENENYSIIKISINNIKYNIEVGESFYINPKYDLTIIQIKEKSILCNKINFIEIDDLIYERDSEKYYNKKSIYIIQYKNQKDISVNFSVINNIFKSQILYNCNLDSTEGLIFNLSNNKLIGIHKENNSYFCKGLFFKFIIKKYINNFRHKLSVENEINITVKIDDILKLNKEIYFLDNYNTEEKEEEKYAHNNFKELNEINTMLYINNIPKKFDKFFIPETLGEYNIKLIFSINLTDCSYMFSGCENITDINFISFKTKYVTSMKYMFYNCNKIKKLNLFSFNTVLVNDMNNMFSGCEKLEYLDLTSFNTKNVININDIFNDCFNLKYIFISFFDISNVKQIDNILHKYINLIKTNISSNDIFYNEFSKKMKNNINYRINQMLLLGSDIKPISIQREIICPFCPLTPIVSIFVKENGILTAEFRCPNLHNGYLPFSDIFKNKDNHGKSCYLCEKETEKVELTKKIIKNEEELLYCGTCKEYICNKCRPQHDKEKESHKILIQKSKVNYTCLEHNKNFYAFCFSCLVDLCPDCIRHKNHSIKTFDILLNEFSFDIYKYFPDVYNTYINSLKKYANFNPELFEIFKKRNKILRFFSKYLYEHLEYKKSLNQLNSGIIINLFNVLDYDLDIPEIVRQNKEDFENYCKNHLILKYKPINYICSFSKNKQDFNISKMELMEYYILENSEEKPKCFKYSPIGDLIIFSSGTNLFLLAPNNSRNKLSKIILGENILSFDIHNKNILSICLICFQNYDIIFYKLIEEYPYYTEDNSLPKIKSPLNDINIQIIGNFNKYIVTRTLGGNLHLYSDKKQKGFFEIIASDKISFLIKDGKNIYELKSIWKKYLVIKNNEYIVIRDLTKQKLDILYKKNILENEKEKDFLVYNGSVLVYKEKEIYFYNIPYLEIVSKIELFDNILSINIINSKTMIVIENNYIEQLEVNTWKKLWIRQEFSNKVINALKPIGVGNKLYFYNDEECIIYYAF